MSEIDHEKNEKVLMGVLSRVERLEDYGVGSGDRMGYVLGWGLVFILLLAAALMALSLVAVMVHWAAHTWGFV